MKIYIASKGTKFALLTEEDADSLAMLREFHASGRVDHIEEWDTAEGPMTMIVSTTPCEPGEGFTTVINDTGVVAHAAAPKKEPTNASA